MASASRPEPRAAASAAGGETGRAGGEAWRRRIRLFVALVPPRSVREELAAWARTALRPEPGLRLLDPASIHVTLAFLGSRDPAEADAISNVGLGAVRGLRAPELIPSGAVALPRHRPRAIAVELADPGGRAAAVRAAVSDALAGAGLHEPDRRPALDHATVARVSRGARAPAPTAPPPRTPFVAAEVVLYRSDTGPQGSRYTRIATADLDLGES